MKLDQTIDAAELRQRAEERLQNQAFPADTSLSAHETQRQLQELQIHQIELEMQNEELRQTRQKLEISQARYFVSTTWHLWVM